MGRWTQYDEDGYRLPEGMTRTGYDADTGKHYFQDEHGHVWSSTSEYGPMTRESGEDGDVDPTPAVRGDGYQAVPTNHPVYASASNTAAYRTLLPFFLMIGVALLCIWKFIFYPALSAPDDPACPGNTQLVIAQPGDSCWQIAHDRGLSLDQLKAANPSLECEPLLAGSTVCIPDGDGSFM